MTYTPIAFGDGEKFPDYKAPGANDFQTSSDSNLPGNKLLRSNPPPGLDLELEAQNRTDQTLSFDFGD
jgi:hypothetical protein